MLYSRTLVPCAKVVPVADVCLQDATGWATGNVTERAQVMSELLTLTIQAQQQQAAAIAAAAELVSASLAITQRTLTDVQLTTALILDGVSTTTFTPDAVTAYEACLTDRGASNGQAWGFEIARYNITGQTNTSAGNGTADSGRRYEGRAKAQDVSVLMIEDCAQLSLLVLLAKCCEAAWAVDESPLQAPPCEDCED